MSPDRPEVGRDRPGGDVGEVAPSVGFRTLVLPDEIERWSLTTLREKVVKIGAKVIAHARYTVFQMAEVVVPYNLFRRILELIDDLRPRRIARC